MKSGRPYNTCHISEMVRVRVQIGARVRVRVRARVMSQLISTTQHITHKVKCQWVTAWRHEPVTLTTVGLTPTPMG